MKSEKRNKLKKKNTTTTFKLHNKFFISLLSLERQSNEV
jgi:hypothetical protein